MRICHVITRLIIGGAQENTLLTCEGLHAAGHDVTLVAGPTRGPEGALVARAQAGGYRYVEVPELVRQINPWLDARAMRELQRELAALRPDVVHTHSSKAGILGRFAAARARVPTVVHTIHGMSFNRTQPALTRMAYAWLERRAARRTHAIITVADAMTEQSVAARVAPRERFTRIYSGMEVAAFTPGRFDRAAVRAEWGLAPSSDVVVVGTIARLFRNKGYEQLLPIMALAAARDPRLHFVWVGDGAQRAAYEARLRDLRLRERTTLVGLVTPDAVPRQLAGMDVLAHASLWEGLPRAVVQALLMRVPAVAFSLDGTPEVLVPGQTGALIAPGDDAGFARALCELAGDAALRRRLGEAGRAHCLERFDARRMVEAIEALYLRLVHAG